MRRSLSYYRRTHLAVTLGAAVACAVLTGALIVGDSVRGSLRDLTLARLGEIERILLGQRPFGQELVERSGEGAEGVLMLRGSVVHGESRARAAGVSVMGVGEGYWGLWPEAGATGREADRTGGLFGPVVLNQALAEELGARPGDEVVISFEQPAEIPRETLVGRRDAVDAVRKLRLSVREIIPDRGPGGFAMTHHQGRPLNAFVDLEELQRAVFGRGERERRRVNLLLMRAGSGEIWRDDGPAGGRPLRMEDAGLFLEVGEEAVTLLSREFVIRPELGRVILELANELGAPTQPVLTYLANAISSGGGVVPYSTITAIDPPPADGLGLFRLVDGSPAPTLGDDEILLNSWAADDLAVATGDDIEVTFFEVGARDELVVATADFRLRGILAMEGLAVDPFLTPEFPGIAEADDISSWDPPFPVELDSIRPRDESYWDDWRAAPKAFVSESTGRRLWRSRFGDLTSIRLAPAAGQSPAELAAAIETGLARTLDPETLGLEIRPLREEGLRQARGATDFAGLFLGLSMFLIAAAAMLVGLLFRLGVEQRAPEIGLLRAVGFSDRSIRRRFLTEGGLLAALGGALGLFLAVGYAALMLAGLRTWWLPAVGTPVLFVHVRATTLMLGWASSLVVVLASIWWSLRRIHRVPATSLLAGSTEVPDESARPRRALAIALAAAGVAAILVAVALLSESASRVGLAFGIGALLLIAGLAWLAHRLGGGRRRANSLGSLAIIGMGARNAGRNRGRSLLSAALVACACFIVVIVAANRVHQRIDVEDARSGAGGFTLMAESDVALVEDLNEEGRRRDLGFSSVESELLEPVTFVPFRLQPGEDVSCLNLYRPERPRVLGVPPELVERGGFSFQQTIEEVPNPWTLLDRELEPGVIPALADNNSALWILHLGLGDDLRMLDENGVEVRLRLVGLLARSVFQSEILISEENFTRLYPSRTGYRVFLADPPLSQAREIGELLEANLGELGFDTTGTDQRIASFLAVESTYLATFQTLGGLGLILGTLGLGIVLLRNVLERRGELATLRAFGFRRVILSWMVLAENAALLVAGIAIGSLSGLVAAAPQLVAGGSGVPWVALVATLAVVFTVGMLASVLAVAGTLEVPLLPALKAE